MHVVEAFQLGLGGLAVDDDPVAPRRDRERGDAVHGAAQLQVDGGITTDTIGIAAEHGADTFVAGSAIFNQPDYKAVIDAMRAELAQVRA